MEEEYYIIIDEVKNEVAVCNYLFDDSHPRGFERKVFTRAYSTAKDSKGRVSVLSNLIIIKKEVSNLKENLEMIESDDVHMCKLHNRIYDLKMSLLNVDKALAELNFLTRKDIQRSETLLKLKDFYLKELRTLEMVL